jgi:hypothetical protein
MSELFDTSGITDDDQHWDALAAKVASNATTQCGREPELIAFAGSGRGLIAATLLVVAAGGAVSLIRPTAAEPLAIEFSEALKPSDDLGRTIVASTAPPSVGALLLQPKAFGVTR